MKGIFNRGLPSRIQRIKKDDFTPALAFLPSHPLNPRNPRLKILRFPLRLL